MYPVRDHDALGFVGQLSMLGGLSLAKNFSCFPTPIIKLFFVVERASITGSSHHLTLFYGSYF